MNENNSDDKLENPSSSTPSFWKPAQYGEWASYDDIVRLDPSLAYVLKPEHNFRILHEGYNHSVKEYIAGKFRVYRQKPSPSSSQSRYNPNQQSGYSDQSKNMNFDKKGLGCPVFDDLFVNKKKIVDIKLVKPDELNLEDGWEILNYRPIEVIREQPFVTLVKWEVNNKD